MNLIRKYFLTFFVILCCIFSMKINTEASPIEYHPPKNLYAKAALLMDASNQRILFSKDGEKQLPMASTTKIMTCLYALEHAKLNETVTFSKRAANAPKVHLGARVGDQYELGDLLYALMLESYNDVAIAIAEHIGGSVEGFCAAMTQEAKDYGCFHTSFITPNGLDSQNHYTTCRDLAILTCRALEKKEFRQIIKEASYTIREKTSGQTHTLQNKNAFLNSYEYAIGVKTGYTSGAGYCFVGAVQTDDHYLISVVLGSGWYPNRSYKWNDTRKLMDYGMDAFSTQSISLTSSISKDTRLTIQKGQKDSIALSFPKEVCLLLSPEEKTDVEVQLPKSLPAPIGRNQIVGTIRLKINNILYRSYPIYAKEAVHRQTYFWCFDRILKKFLNSSTP